MKIVNKILDIAAVAALCIMFSLVMLQVVMRYVFDSPLTWSEELARYSLAWLAFIGAILAMREGQHIDITVLVDNVPEKLKKWLAKISTTISALFLVLLIYLSMEFVLMNLHNNSPVTDMTMGYVYLCLPISAVGMLVFLLRPKKENT